MLVAFISTAAAYMWLILIPFPVVVALLFALFRPYKNNCFNIVDCLGFTLLALSTFLIMYTMQTMPIPIQLVYVVLLIPFLYFIVFTSYKILFKVALFRTCCSRIREMLKAKTENQHLHIQTGDNTDGDFPDRIMYHDMYQDSARCTYGWVP